MSNLENIFTYYINIASRYSKKLFRTLAVVMELMAVDVIHKLLIICEMQFIARNHHDVVLQLRVAIGTEASMDLTHYWKSPIQFLYTR